MTYIDMDNTEKNEFERIDKIYKVFPYMIKNIRFIYGDNYSKGRLMLTYIFSIIFLPIYIIVTLTILIRLVVLVFLFSPFYMTKIVLGYTWGMDDVLLGIYLLPFTAAYLALYYISLVPFVLIGLIGDILARLISPRNHHSKYGWLTFSPLIAPHKVMEYDLKKNMNF